MMKQYKLQRGVFCLYLVIFIKIPDPISLEELPYRSSAIYGNAIPNLTGSVVFTDLAKKEDSRPPVNGVLAYTRAGTDGKHADFHAIETNYDFGTQAAYYMSLGTNLNQTKLYLGVYGSMKVTDFNKGTILKLFLIRYTLVV